MTDKLLVKLKQIYIKEYIHFQKSFVLRIGRFIKFGQTIAKTVRLFFNNRPNIEKTTFDL